MPSIDSVTNHLLEMDRSDEFYVATDFIKALGQLKDVENSPETQINLKTIVASPKLEALLKLFPAGVEVHGRIYLYF